MSVPFTRLSVPDAATNRAIQDIYDKLQVLTQVQPSSAPIPAAADNPAPSAAIRKVTSSTTVQKLDQTISFNVTADSSCLLPPTRIMLGTGPFTIQNSSGSTGTVTLASALGELVNGALPGTYVLAAGKSITLLPNPGSWVIANRLV